MSDLQDALADAEEFPVGAEAYNRTENAWIVDVVVVEAARRVANLDYQAAHDVATGYDPDMDEIKSIVDAALGTTE